METITLDQCGTTVQIPSDKENQGQYQVQLPQGDFLLLIVPTIYPSAASKFNHPNILAKRDTVMEFKHYRKAGSKFWTSQPGVEFILAIPKSRIALVMERGYSNVPVIINGKRTFLNVSGGTINGWTDSVHQGCTTGVTTKKSVIQALAEAAMTREEAAAYGLDKLLAEKLSTEGPGHYFSELCAKKVVKLKPGMKTILAGSYSIDGEHGPFEVVEKYKRQYVVKSKHRPETRVKERMIDWVKTGEVNGIASRLPICINYFSTP
jgi:hypothetical protein